MLPPWLLKYHPAANGCASCPECLPALKGRTFAKSLTPSFPVDIVYTWVDGGDPAHSAKRAKMMGHGEQLIPENSCPGRFRDNDELKYSLRSLEKYAPWARSIFILTDQQKPAWLNEDHPKVQIVDHRDCIPHQFLPTFNAQVIEAYLHKIPGLAEHFIYFNDDVFLGRPTQKTDFFTPNGLPVTFVDWRWRRRFGYWYTKTSHACSYFNMVKLLQQKHLPVEKKFVSAHGPLAQTQANVQEVFSVFADFITNFSSNTFRGLNEIGMYSHAAPLYMYAKKRVIPCDTTYYYVQTQRKDRHAYFSGILRSKDTVAAPLFFCINDVGGLPGEDWADDLHHLLESYFPESSSFEKPLPQYS